MQDQNQKPPRPQVVKLEYQGFPLRFKGYLNSHAFSFRCANHTTCKCDFLLTVPINDNYDTTTWERRDNCFYSEKRPKGRDHSRACKLKVNPRLLGENPTVVETDGGGEVIEWKSDNKILESFIRSNLKLGPSIIQAQLRQDKQEFTKATIKRAKKMILEELFPSDHKIAFAPDNCIAKHPEDLLDDNLFRYSSRYPRMVRSRKTDKNALSSQEFYIFGTRTMLYQLENARQIFIDGTFSIAPMGFQQVLTVIAYLDKYKVFYPTAFILLTDKSELSYRNALTGLKHVMNEENFQIKAKLIMSDFESGLQNAIKTVFEIRKGSDSPQLVGCYFHYIKALIKKAKKLGLLVRNEPNRKAKLLIGLLKIFAHTPPDKKEEFFEELTNIFRPQGSRFEKFLNYFRKNWLRDDFLEELIDAYTKNDDIRFLRTNNACEIFNRYLGQVFEYTNPRAGYFVEKLKDIEYSFRAEYLENCRGKKKKQKYNFQKNPLESIKLPNYEILEMCTQTAKSGDFNLKKLQKEKHFFTAVEALANDYISQIEFLHLQDHKESERKHLAENGYENEDYHPIQVEEVFEESDTKSEDEATGQDMEIEMEQIKRLQEMKMEVETESLKKFKRLVQIQQNHYDNDSDHMVEEIYLGTEPSQSMSIVSSQIVTTVRDFRVVTDIPEEPENDKLTM